MKRRVRFAPSVYLDYFGQVARTLREHGVETLATGGVLTEAENDRMQDAAECGEPPELFVAWVLVKRGALVNRIRQLEVEQEKMRGAINRILTRFATEGQPIPAPVDEETIDLARVA